MSISVFYVSALRSFFDQQSQTGLEVRSYECFSAECSDSKNLLEDAAALARNPPHCSPETRKELVESTSTFDLVGSFARLSAFCCGPKEKEFTPEQILPWTRYELVQTFTCARAAIFPTWGWSQLVMTARHGHFL